jgi:hypothetical protein
MVDVDPIAACHRTEIRHELQPAFGDIRFGAVQT